MILKSIVLTNEKEKYYTCGYFDPVSSNYSILPVLIRIPVIFCFNYTAAQNGSFVNRPRPYDKSVFKTSTINQVTVTKWGGGKKSAFSFSFDDGRCSLSAGNIIFNQTRSAADDLDKLNSNLDILQNQTIPNSKWAIFLAHDIAPADSIYSGKVTDYYPVSTQRLTSLCEWLKQKSDENDIWVATVADVLKYMKERDNFPNSVITSADSKIEITPSVASDTSIYNYLLTVDIEVPAAWS